MALSRRQEVVGGLVALGILAAVLMSVEGWRSRSGAHPSAAPTLDAGAQLACGEWASLSDDLPKLNDAELRERLRTVYEDAKPWPDSAVAVASRDAMAAITRGDRTSFGTAATALIDACRAK